MQAHAYNYQGRMKQIKKSLGSFDYINFEYVNGTTALNPYIRWTVNDDNTFTWFKWNYVIINYGSTTVDWATRERRYFVDVRNAKNIAKGVWEIPLQLDVLSTYAKEILSNPANVARSSSNYNLYLNDEFYHAFAYPRIGCKEFPSGFSDEYTYLLTVCNSASYAEQLQITKVSRETLI